MRIKLPKDLRGVYFPRITSIEFNDFDVDMLLPSLFFRILAEGAGRARHVNDPTAMNEYVRALAKHPDLQGFDSPDGERLLHRVVRTSLAVTGRLGQNRQVEQLLSVAPYSILSHKTGLPSASARQRNVDTFLYHILRDRSGSDLELRRFMSQVFGKGVILGRLPQLGGQYDGITPLDTLTRLSLAFLDGFQPTAAGRSLGRSWTEACPSLAQALGGDIQRYLYTYYDRMPAQALTYHLLGLINLELFVYTLKLVHAINELVRNPAELPRALRDDLSPSPPDLYVDFSGEPGGLSQQMAAAGVRRDMDAYGQFLSSALTLRQLDRYALALSRNARIRDRIAPVLELRNHSSPEYLQALLQMLDDSTLAVYVDAQAQADEDAIREENRKAAVDEDEADDLSWLDALLPDHLTPLQRVVTLLFESQKKAVTNLGRWYWGAGGLLKPHGLLAGTPTGRRAWRYQPGNDLIAVLVQLAAIQAMPHSGGNEPQPIPLRDFLNFLYQRFGIIVDRPPPPYEGSEAVAAARDNLRALLRRLRQMGIFRDLSDDFTVQHLDPPYAARVVPA